jgi:hypothetical protein
MSKQPTIREINAHLASHSAYCYVGLPDGRRIRISRARTRKDTPYVARDSRLRRKGYTQRAMLRPAVVRIQGTGMGLSGSAWVVTIDPVTGQGACAWLPSL